MNFCYSYAADSRIAMQQVLVSSTCRASRIVFQHRLKSEFSLTRLNPNLHRGLFSTPSSFILPCFKRHQLCPPNPYISYYLSALLCGFRKGYNTQHALIRMLEKLKGSLDNGENIGAVLMDLSKAFDCIKHDQN